MFTLASGLLERAFSGLVARLFVEAIPLPQTASFYRSAQWLRAIGEGDTSAQTKLRDVAAVLHSLDASLANQSALGSAPIRALKAYLQTVLPWLDEVDELWQDFDLTLREWEMAAGWAAKADSLLGAIDRLSCASPLRDVVRQPAVAECLGQIQDLRRLLAKVQLLESLPGHATLIDYIGLLTDGAQWPERFASVLQPVVMALSNVCRDAPCPTGAGLGDQIEWLMMTLGDPASRVRLQPHLDMIFGDARQARQVTSVLQVAQSLVHYPSDLSLVQQARWLVGHVVSSDVMGAFDVDTFGWAGALVADPHVMAAFDAMLSAEDAGQGWTRMMESLGNAALLSAGPWALGQVVDAAKHYALHWGTEHAASWLSGGVLTKEVQTEIQAFYQGSMATESWSDMLYRVSTCMGRVARSCLANHLMGDPAAAATVRYAELLKTHTDWKQTLAWFIAQDRASDATVEYMHSHFTTVLICWKVYEALNIGHSEQAEDALNELARSLRDMAVVRRFPQLRMLVDLLPLLPAMRDVGLHCLQGGQGAGAATSWWERAATWQQALLDTDSPAAHAAAERLSRCAEGWLVDAGMVACEYLARSAIGLPGAQARPADGPVVASPSRVSDAPVPLAAGATLGVIGALGLVYGIWRCVHGQADYVPVGTTRVPTGSRALPVLVSLASLTAGGCLVYPYVTGWLTAVPQDDVPQLFDAQTVQRLRAAHPDFAAAVDSLDLPEWGQMGDDASASGASARRVQRDLDLGPRPLERAPADMKGWLESVVENANLERETGEQFAMLIVRCAYTRYVLDGKDMPEKCARVLIKLMQAVHELAQDLDYLDEKPGNATRLKDMWKALRPAYESQLYGQHSKEVGDFGRLFLVDENLEIRKGPGAEAPVNLVDLAKARQADAAATLKRIYDPILAPAIYIIDHIQAGITRFHKRTGKAGNLTPHSKLEVTLDPWFGGSSNRVIMNRIPVKRRYSILDIVTGEYHYEIKKLDSRGWTYRVRDIELHDLIEEIRGEGLEETMLGLLESYRSDESRVREFKRFQEGMIVQRCLSYLDRKDNFPLFAQSVTRFLANDLNAKLLIFRDQVVSGAFCIPIRGHKMALILSIDEPVCFHVFEFEHRYHDRGDHVALLPSFPINPEFRDWIYTKIPIRHAMRYPKNDATLRNKFESFIVESRPIAVRYSNVLTSQPLTLSGPVHRNDLPGLLFEHCFDRIKSDIDTLIFTPGERMQLHYLEVLKTALNFVGAAMTIGLPGSGTLLAVACAFLAGVSLGALGSAAAVLQSKIADRPEEIDAYTLDAIIGAGVSVLTSMPDMKAFGRLLAQRSLPLTKIHEAVTVYRAVRTAVRNTYGLPAPRRGRPPRPLAGHRTLEMSEKAAPDRSPPSGGVVRIDRPSSSAIDTPLDPGPPPTTGSTSDAMPDFGTEGQMTKGNSNSGGIGRIRGHIHYPRSTTFKSFDLPAVPGRETVGYRTLGDTPYVQIYTIPAEGETARQSKTLVVSAHGGYRIRDTPAPVIPMPPRMTLDMLCPHDTVLFDPTVDTVINDPNFRAYLSVSGHAQQVNFIPQTHARWFFGEDYDPAAVVNTHGPVDGLANYEHFQFDEKPGELALALIHNRLLAADNVVPRSDILVMNDDVSTWWQTDPSKASVAKVLEMDRDGLLTNAQGVCYEKIVFSHCRANFDLPPGLASAYEPVLAELRAAERSAVTRWKRAIYETTVIPQRGETPERVTTRLVSALIYVEPGSVQVVRASTEADASTTTTRKPFVPRDRMKTMSFHSSADRW